MSSMSLYTKEKRIAPLSSSTSGSSAQDKRRRIDNLVARFHADRMQVSGARCSDVAAVFAAPGTPLDAHVMAAFRCAPPERPFAPFDVALVPPPLLPPQLLPISSSLPSSTLSPPSLYCQGFGTHCYVLRADNENGRNCSFEPYYCIAGCPLRAVKHYRIDFDALLRLLFYHRYRYVLKPIIVDRCLSTSNV
jgi:hypothetical protein